MRYVVSCCLLGCNCKYNGGNNACEELMEYLNHHEVISVCPEVFGGLSIPRASSEIRNGKVINTKGEDVTKEFYLGAELALQQTKEFQAELVIVQPRSPSCGKGLIYDGTFQKKLIPGNGIFVEMLMKENIPVMNCDEFLENVINKGKNS